jgi:hypothetical protein
MSKPKMIRGVTSQEYAKWMHQIEKGKTTDEALVRRGVLKPSTKSISPLERASAKIFNNRNKTKGRGKPGECRVPKCTKSSSRRGLCNTHRTEAYMMIKRGKTTEQNLLNRKLLLPKASGGVRVAGKKVVKKRTSGKKRKIGKKKKAKKKATRTAQRSKIKFPKKLLESTTCLFRKCKITRIGGGRGLCTKHYSQYKRKRAKLSDRNKVKQEKDLIRRKMLLPPRAKAKAKGRLKRRKKKKPPESSAFDIGSTMHGSIRRY